MRLRLLRLVKLCSGVGDVDVACVVPFHGDFAAVLHNCGKG